MLLQCEFFSIWKHFQRQESWNKKGPQLVSVVDVTEIELFKDPQSDFPRSTVETLEKRVEICSNYMTSFWCFYCWLWTYFTPFSSASNGDFEQVNVNNISNVTSMWFFFDLKTLPASRKLKQKRTSASVCSWRHWNWIVQRSSKWLPKVNSRNTRKTCGNMFKLYDVVLVFLLLTLNRSHTFFLCFYCSLWTSKC